MTKKWQIFPKISQKDKNEFPEINPVILQLLYNRAINTQEKIDEFLNIDYGQDQHDPFLFNDMEKATTRILKALKKQEKVVIYGDYDADGVSATALLYKVFKDLGFENLKIYIPYRLTEGYGMNKKAIDGLKDWGVQLIVTVDCGIANKEEVAYTRELGIDVIVTDHHHEPLAPPDKALAIINPKVKKEKFPFKDLAGVGVAFKLAQGLILRAKKHFRDLGEGYEKWLLDLVAIGTVTDCVDIIGENRTLTKFGLLVINKTRTEGLKKLIEKAKLNLGELDAWNISFQIGPRINAAGRLNHASTSFKLLISDDQQEIERLVENIESTNQERQRITERILNEAKSEISKEDLDKKILFALGDGWSTGVVGLVAGKLSDEYYRPAVVMGREDGEVIGSGRSIPEFDIISAIEKLGKFFDHYGGHAQACGFSMKAKNVDEFKKALNQLVEEDLADMDLAPRLKIDSEIKLSDINWDLYKELEMFKPNGTGNPQPVFLVRNLKIIKAENVGKKGQHLKLMIEAGQVRQKLIGFNLSNIKDWIKKGSRVDAVISVDVNEWNNTRELQLKILDLKPRK